MKTLYFDIIDGRLRLTDNNSSSPNIPDRIGFFNKLVVQQNILGPERSFIRSKKHVPLDSVIGLLLCSI